MSDEKGNYSKRQEKVAPFKGNWILESEEFLLVETGILGSGIGKQRKESGIQNPSSTDKESDIQDQESRIQDCLGFCYMGRKKPSVFKVNKFISFRNIGQDKKPEKLNKNQNLPSSLSAAQLTADLTTLFFPTFCCCVFVTFLLHEQQPPFRENSPRTPRAIVLSSKPPLLTQKA